MTEALCRCGRELVEVEGVARCGRCGFTSPRCRCEPRPGSESTPGALPSSAELSLPERCVLAALLRGGGVAIPVARFAEYWPERVPLPAGLRGASSVEAVALSLFQRGLVVAGGELRLTRAAAELCAVARAYYDSGLMGVSLG